MVCGFRVRVWESYRTSGSFVYGYGSVTQLTEVPGRAERTYRTPTNSGEVKQILYPYPGYCSTGRTELTEVPGIVTRAYRTYRSSRYGYECHTKLTEILCRVIPG